MGSVPGIHVGVVLGHAVSGSSFGAYVKQRSEEFRRKWCERRSRKPESGREPESDFGCGVARKLESEE